VKGRFPLATSLALAVTAGFTVIALGHWLGGWGTEWSALSPLRYAPASGQHWLGTNAIGQDILSRAISSAATTFEVGVPVSLGSALLGLVAGGVMGYYRGSGLDHVLQWLTGVLDAIPFLLLVAAVVWAMNHHPMAMHLAMLGCFWTTTARLVRAEVIRLKPLPYVESARALGLSDARILTRHLLPNTLHVVLVQATIVFVAAVKTEVILSFLGMGLRDGVSWGVMIAEAGQDVLVGQFNNFLVGSLALFAMVMAFNQLADALQDALDPRVDPS